MIKNYIYSNPIVSSVLVNSTCTVMTLKVLNSEKYILLIPLIITYFFNKKILLRGENLNKIKKIALFGLFFLMISVIFIFNKYIFNSLFNLS